MLQQKMLQLVYNKIGMQAAHETQHIYQEKALKVKEFKENIKIKKNIGMQAARETQQIYQEKVKE